MGCDVLWMLMANSEWANDDRRTSCCPQPEYDVSLLFCDADAAQSDIRNCSADCGSVL